jgi:Domain of unknown function (DUF4352)
MYGELGAVRGIVDLSPERALDEAEAFLASLGYRILRRTSTTLTAERRSSEETAGEAVPNLTVVAMPQPEGGGQIKIRGNDFEGVQARQTEWMGWSESLPRKAQGEAGAPTEDQGGIQTPEVELPPPPAVESPTRPAPAPAADVPLPPPQPPPTTTAPPPPRRESTVWRGTKLAFGGCVVLPVLLAIGFVGVFALFAGGGGDGGSGSGESRERKAQQAAVDIGQPVHVGEVTWTVTNARQVSEIKEKGFGQFGETKRDNFVIVDFNFTNDSSEAVTLDSASLSLIDSSGNKSEVDPDYSSYVPANKDIFLENVNPDVTRPGEVIFTVAPDASGFKLQVGDTIPFTDKNGYVDLGF